MPIIIENAIQYDLSEAEVTLLKQRGFIVRVRDRSDSDQYEFAAMVWSDFGLEGDAAFDLLDVLLKRNTPRRSLTTTKRKLGDLTWQTVTREDFWAMLDIVTKAEDLCMNHSLNGVQIMDVATEKQWSDLYFALRNYFEEPDSVSST